MKRMESGKKLLSILLCLCMLLQNAPMTAFAAAGDNLCAHHSSHNDSCGYTPADPGSPCTHAHSENCYVDTDGTMVKDCHHAHGDCGFTPDIPEKPCGHSHDGSCGYAEPKQPIPCGHSCEINGCTLNEDGTYTCLHTACDKSCGYFAGDPGTPCGHTECDNTCGYAPKVPGTPCTHECQVKSGCYKLLCSHADGGHDKECGYIAPKAESPCTYSCTACAAEAQKKEGAVCICGAAEEGETVHAPMCDLFVRSENPKCDCSLSCAVEGLNDYCEVCHFGGIGACKGKGEMAFFENDETLPYTITLDKTLIVTGYLGEEYSDILSSCNKIKIEKDGVFDIAAASFSNSFYNYGTIKAGKFTATVTNRGTIEGGTFNYSVVNEGIINGGNFPLRDVLKNKGTITGGTFSSSYSCTNEGIITGGEFTLPIKNTREAQISGGVFNGKMEENRGVLSGGTFNGEINNNENGTISGGIFNAKVNNSGKIHDGIFHGKVSSYGTISGGKFYKAVTISATNAKVTGGEFKSAPTGIGVTINTAPLHVCGSSNYDTVLDSYTITQTHHIPNYKCYNTLTDALCSLDTLITGSQENHFTDDGTLANCMGLKCIACGQWYSDKDPNTHLTQKEENKANCSRSNICDLCNSQYGEERNPEKHISEITYWKMVPDAADPFGVYHGKYHSCCDAPAKDGNGDPIWEEHTYNTGSLSYNRDGKTVTFAETCAVCNDITGKLEIGLPGGSHNGLPHQCSQERKGSLNRDIPVRYCCETGCIAPGTHTLTFVFGEKYGEVSFEFEITCDHSYNTNGAKPDQNGDTHGFTCSVCMKAITGQPHIFADGVCTCGAKKTYSVSMHSKAAGVKIVGNPVATHGEQLTVTLENTASRKIAGVWLREVYLGSEWLNLNQNGITFDAATNTVTIPGELVRDNIQINAYAYLSITLDPAGGVYNTNGMIFDTHFSENEDGIWVSDDDYFMAGYTYSFSRLFVKEGSKYLHLEDAAGTKYTQEHIDPSSDLDFTYIWECLHRTTKVVDSGDGTHKVVCANDGHPIETDIAHTPIYTLNEAGDTITLSCKEDCGYIGTARVDISGKTYDGESIGHTPVETDGALANTAIYPTYYQNGEEYNGTPTNVGTYTAVCTLGDVTASREFTIAKAPLTVTAVDNTITYGDLPAANGVEFSGFVNSENHTYLGGTVTYSYDYSQYGDAGTYRIVPSGLSYENYQITYVPGKLTVNPRKVELTWNNVQDRSYGDGKTVTAAIGNLLNGDQVSVTVTGGDAAVIGTHTAKAESLTGEKAKNYTLTGVENNTQEYLINKALLNSLVNAPADRTLETYCSDVDDVIQELPASVTYTAQNGDVTAQIQWSCDSYDPTPGAANTFVWEVSAGQLENHDAGNVMTSGTVTVTNAAALTVTHTGKNVQITYTGEAYDVSQMFEVDANAGNESYTVMGITGEGTLNGTDLTVTKAGTFTVKLTTAAQGAYGTGEAVATLTVTKANISDHVRIYFQSRYYDGTPVQLEVIRKNTMQASNLVEGVDYSITCVGDHLVNGMPFRAGEYKVILTGMGNYTGTVTDIYIGMLEGIIPVYEETLVIDPAPISVYDEDIDVADKTYDGTKTAAVSCFIASDAIVVGDDVKVEVKGEFSDAKVGKDKLVNLTYTLSGADSGNYVIYGPKTTTADIIPAKLNVTAKSGSKVYGETDPALTYDVTGLVGDEELTGSLTRESGENAGTYDITVGTLAAGSNYTMDFTGATFTVQMRNASAEAEDQTIVYGEAISQEKYTVTGLLAGHTATATLVPSTDKVTASGEIILEDVKITAEGIDVTDNYDIAIAAPAKLVINPDTTKIQKLTDKNVTSSDRDEIQAVLDQLADADIEGADEGTAEKWGALKENCEALLEKIDAVEKDVAECKKAAAAIDADTVTSADQGVLEDLSEKLDKLLISDNLTDAERKELEKVQKTVADMLDTLARTEADSKAAMDTIEGLNNNNVTSADKGDLEKSIDTIDKLLSDTHLTEAERKQLIEAKAEAQKLLGVIETVQQSTETENTAKVENVNSGNVKPTDKKALVDAKSDLEKVLKDYGSNLTAEEKAEIETEIDRIESALASLEKAEAVTAAIEALPMDVEPDDEKTGEKILAAKAGYDALTVHEKSLVPEDSVKKLEKLIYALTDYEITDVKNGKWSKGSDKGITFIVNGPLDKFIGIEIDGAHVYRFLYTADAGSTIITLRTILLGTLSNGDHTITVIYEDGEVSGTFRILPRATSAATGDSSDVYIWTCTLAISATVLAILVMNRKRSAKR